MKTKTIYFWRPPPKGRQRVGLFTRWLMSEEEAAASYPGAVRQEYGSITLDVAETPEEAEAMRASQDHGMRDYIPNHMYSGQRSKE